MDKRFNKDVELNRLPQFVKQQIENDNAYDDYDEDERGLGGEEWDGGVEGDEDQDKEYDGQNEKQFYLKMINTVMPG